MIHGLRLHNNPFEKIKSGTKTIEMRLYDEKRRLINIGDIIEFTNRTTLEKIRVEVINLYLFNSFKELYDNFDNLSIGYDLNENKDFNDMYKYYTKEDQRKYGVVGIEIKILKK